MNEDEPACKAIADMLLMAGQIEPKKSHSTLASRAKSLMFRRLREENPLLPGNLFRRSEASRSMTFVPQPRRSWRARIPSPILQYSSTSAWLVADAARSRASTIRSFSSARNSGYSSTVGRSSAMASRCTTTEEGRETDGIFSGQHQSMLPLRKKKWLRQPVVRLIDGDSVGPPEESAKYQRDSAPWARLI